MTFRGLAAAAALAALLLAGCAGVAPRPGTPFGSAAPPLAAAWQQHLARISGIEAFTLDARVAASGSFGVTGTLHWAQRGAVFTARFSGPLGSGAVEITGTPEVVLIRSGTDRYTTTQPEHFLLQRFGWTLPLAGLRHWALGIPASGPAATPATALNLNPDGTLRTLQQGGWEIDYPQYQPVAGHRLPRKITLQGKKIHVRIIIDQWGLAAAHPA